MALSLISLCLGQVPKPFCASVSVFKKIGMLGLPVQISYGVEFINKVKCLAQCRTHSTLSTLELVLLLNLQLPESQCTEPSVVSPYRLDFADFTLYLQVINMDYSNSHVSFWVILLLHISFLCLLIPTIF